MSSSELKQHSLIDFPDEYTCVTIGSHPVFMSDYGYNRLCHTLYAAHVLNGSIIDVFSSIFDFSDGFVSDAGEQIHGVDETFSPVFSLIGDRPVVGYNNSYVYMTLLRYAQHSDFPFSSCYIDAARIARKLWPTRLHHRMEDVSLYTDIDASALFEYSYDDPYYMKVVCELTITLFEEMKRITLSKYSIDEFRDLFKRKQIPISLVASTMKPHTDVFDDTHPFFGKRIVFTGALSRMTRKEAAQLVLDVGGMFADSLNKETNYLVIGNEDFKSCVKDGKSSKMLKAEQMQKKGLDIQVISEDQFFDMIEL